MQNATPFWSSPLAFALQAIAIAIASIVSAFLGHLFTKKRQSADIHRTNADTRKTIAESDKTAAETRQIDSEILLRAFERLEELEEMNRDQSSEIIGLERDRARLEWELSLSEQREKIHIEELRMAQAELELSRKVK